MKRPNLHARQQLRAIAPCQPSSTVTGQRALGLHSTHELVIAIPQPPPPNQTPSIRITPKSNSHVDHLL